jgi:hypothetical protein
MPYHSTHNHRYCPFEGQAPKKLEGKIKLFPMDIHGTIREVARLILWLSSDETRVLSPVFNDTN